MDKMLFHHDLTCREKIRAVVKLDLTVALTSLYLGYALHDDIIPSPSTTFCTTCH